MSHQSPHPLPPKARAALLLAIDLHRAAELLQQVPQQFEARRLRAVLLQEVDRLWPTPTPAKRASRNPAGSE